MSAHPQNAPIALVGSGLMAQAYAKVLTAQGREFCVIGRGAESAVRFRDATGIAVSTGGLDRWLDDHGAAPHTAIVAVNLSMLADVSAQLLRAGTQRLLIEKPGAIDRSGLTLIQQAAAASCADVFIAYNRRFYASTLAAEELAQADGGITSFQFEFTEWTHRIGVGSRPADELAAWFFANSSHVVDLAFHLGGQPVQWQAWAGGKLDWHPHGSIFCGAGATDRGALFSYQANWQALGRWSVELLTRKHRLHLRPMESLGVQDAGSLEIKPFALDDQLDRDYKPGLYRQTQAFLDGADAHRLPTLAEHVHFWDTVLEVIAGGSQTVMHRAA
ncbi:MAG: NAD(P)-binding domain-containing protein [Planctomycetaceae bacterium]|nr:NAD(P)-binding domain-containing protein [Planctomycetaceae bacterium]